MMRRASIAAIATVSLALLAPAAPAAAGADVQRHGSCSDASDWKMKLTDDGARIEVEFEVDQNVTGNVWRVRMLHDGGVFFRGTRTTRGASGSFDITRHVGDGSGTDRFVGRARNTSTGETCRATASI